MPEPALERSNQARSLRRLADARGLTVLEILVALAILIVALGAIYGVVRNAATSAGISEDLLDVQQNARLALERLVEEARWTRRVVAAGPSRLDLEIGPDNPRVPGCTYTVRFDHNGADDSFVRSVLSASGSCGTNPTTSEPVASFVTDLTFTYCDAAGACGGMIPLGEIIRVEAEIEVAKGRLFAQRRMVGGAALLRNVGAAGAATPTPGAFTAPWRPTPGHVVVAPPPPTVAPPPTAPPTPRPPRTATVPPTPRPPRTATVPPTPRPTRTATIAPPTVAPTVPPPTPTWTPPRPR